MTKAEKKLLKAFLHLQQAFTACLELEGSEATEDGHWSAFHFDKDGYETFNIFGGQLSVDISYRNYKDGNGWRLEA